MRPCSMPCSNNFAEICLIISRVWASTSTRFRSKIIGGLRRFGGNCSLDNGGCDDGLSGAGRCNEDYAALIVADRKEGGHEGLRELGPHLASVLIDLAFGDIYVAEIERGYRSIACAGQDCKGDQSAIPPLD